MVARFSPVLEKLGLVGGNCICTSFGLIIFVNIYIYIYIIDIDRYSCKYVESCDFMDSIGRFFNAYLF